jgi:L-ribulose-5-phosphate 3-epimerase
MDTIDRRTFLKTSSATVATAALAAVPLTAARPAGADVRWRKAFMLGGALKSGTVRDEFQLLKDAGFEGVEIQSPGDVDRGEILRARDQTGLVIHGVCCSRHWQSPLSDPDPQVVERCVASIRQALDDCQAFGGTTVLVVPAVVTKKVSYRDAYTRSQAAIRSLIPDAEKHGVKIAVEEVWNKFLLTPPEFVRYVDDFQSPWVGAYFDVGNVVEYGFPEQWIRELGKRILKVHIKEYGRQKRFSYPLGEGDIDWAAVRSALIDVGYSGWISAEVPKGDLASLKDVVRRMDQLLGTG